jgi:threonine aldolase
MRPTSTRPQFASDNYAGVCPEAWSALAEANAGHAPAYGADPWTAEAVRLVRELLETDCEVFLVWSGTAANSLALSALCRPFESVLCHEAAHVATDECGAPHLFSGGLTLAPAAGAGGKLAPGAIEAFVAREGDVHAPRPRAISLTQATELGTVYSPAEVRALCAAARARGLRVHVDGARLANAVASLGVRPRELTWEAGVDVLSLGGTKGGMAGGEAVVFFDRDLAREFEYRRKQGGQLASKMRFLAAPWVGMLRTGAWLARAHHANAMAELLRSAVAGLPGVEVLHPRQANSVFVRFPPGATQALHARGWRFYEVSRFGGARLMCAWDTREEDVHDFVADLREVLGVS